MVTLYDPQHEKFALEYVELAFSGNRNPLIEAYKAAGYAPHRGNATRLRRQPKVSARITELMREAAEFANCRVKRVVVEVDRVGRANIADLMEPAFDDHGREIPGTFKWRDLTKLPRELTAAIKGVSYDAKGRMQIDLHDRNQANFMLLKHLGGLPEEPSASVHVNILNALSIDDQQAVADLIEAFPRGPGAIEGDVAGERGAPAALPEAV
jgi:hypothetical protein